MKHFRYFLFTHSNINVIKKPTKYSIPPNYSSRKIGTFQRDIQNPASLSMMKFFEKIVLTIFHVWLFSQKNLYPGYLTRFLIHPWVCLHILVFSSWTGIECLDKNSPQFYTVSSVYNLFSFTGDVIFYGNQSDLCRIIR